MPKAASKKTAKKSAAKKPAKKSARKVVAKKATRKGAVKKASAKKTSARRTTAKKSAGKKGAAKKSAAKQAAPGASQFAGRKLYPSAETKKANPRLSARSMDGSKRNEKTSSGFRPPTLASTAFRGATREPLSRSYWSMTACIGLRGDIGSSGP